MSPTSPSDTSLVERLRKLVILDEVGSDNPLGRNAADRIEALEAERNALIRSIGEHITVRSEYLSRAELAEARNRELEAGLREIASLTHTEKLLWWQIKARALLTTGDRDD